MMSEEMGGFRTPPPLLFSQKSEIGLIPGLHKVVILLSEITETPISHGNFSLEITYEMPKNGYFWQNKFLSQKQVTVTEFFVVVRFN